MNAHLLIPRRWSATKNSLTHDLRQLDRLVRRKLRILGSQHIEGIHWRQSFKKYLCLKPVADRMQKIFFKLKWLNIVTRISYGTTAFKFYQTRPNTIKHDQPQLNLTKEGVQTTKFLVTKQCFMVSGRQTFPVCPWLNINVRIQDQWEFDLQQFEIILLLLGSQM